MTAIAVTLGLLLFAAPAHADVLAVQTFADGGGTCTATGGGGYSCPTLRSAVEHANGTPSGESADVITLGQGTYTLTSELPAVLTDTAFAGLGATKTTIRQTASGQRVLSVDDAAVSLYALTVSGGTGSSGGNLLVGAGATLAVTQARVTGGQAAGSGGGIANDGQTAIQYSLLDGNGAANGGAVYNGSGGQLGVVSSTLANNAASSGAAIYAVAGTSVSLIHATVGRNTGGAAVYFAGTLDAVAYGSIFAANAAANCAGLPFSDATASIDSGSACGVTNPNTDPQLAAALSNQGGETAVLAIPATSPAVGLVNPCLSELLDQRLAQRVSSSSEACDAGAYEVGVSVDPPPTPTPVPPAPTPAPPAPPAPVPTVVPDQTPPVQNRSVGIEADRPVPVRLPGKKRFAPLADGVIPNGSEVDARKLTVTISTARGERAEFKDGIFVVRQSGGLTTLTLSEKLTGCASGKRARAAAKKVKKRQLWGDGKGKFRVRGKYSAATVRGTKWLVRDTCTATLTRVSAGSVTVRDSVRKRQVVLRRGTSYTARAKR